MHWEEVFRTTAEKQDGVIGRDQLPTLGCNSDHWWQARRNRRWTVLSPRVLHLRGTPLDDAARARAGVLDAGGGALLHGPSALAWFGFRDYDLSTIHVTRARSCGGRPCDLAVVHRLRCLAPEDCTVVRGVPTVTPLRAIWSEASRYASPEVHDLGVVRIGRLVDDAHSRNLLRWSELHRSVDDLRRRGRAGSLVMAALLPERRPGTSPTETRLEARFAEIVRLADMSPFTPQQVVGGETVIGRVDFRDRDLALVMEINSLAYHSTPSDQDSDEIRYDALVEAGFTVGVVWEDDLWSAPSAVEELVRTARTYARTGKGAVLHSPSCPWPYDPRRVIVGRRRRPLRG